MKKAGEKDGRTPIILYVHVVYTVCARCVYCMCVCALCILYVHVVYISCLRPPVPTVSSHKPPANSVEIFSANCLIHLIAFLKYLGHCIHVVYYIMRRSLLQCCGCIPVVSCYLVMWVNCSQTAGWMPLLWAKVIVILLLVFL